jgi:hypothetical protein
MRALLGFLRYWMLSGTPFTTRLADIAGYLQQIITPKWEKDGVLSQYNSARICQLGKTFRRAAVSVQ